MRAKTSDADPAFQLFCSHRNANKLLRVEDPLLSEADTRAKLIDPIFRDVLGWSEPEIRREQPSSSGFADYVLGSDAAYLLVEAKRSRPRFRLNVPSKARKLQLDGPHLLKQAKMKPALEQVQSYASDLGAQVAILTNGTQFVMFRPYLPGRSWTKGVALAFHDHEDIAQDFAYFFSVLSRDSVVSGQLLDAFEDLEGITERLYAPIQHVYDGDGEMVRNPFWRKISGVVGPLFSDQNEDPEFQEEIIRSCYVTTGITDETDEALNRLLQDMPTAALNDAGVEHTEPSSRGGFAHNLRSDVEKRRPGTFIVTGGVGSGKTTFLKRHALVVQPGFLKEFCIWVHVDFLVAGDVQPEEAAADIEAYVYSKIRKIIEQIYPEEMPVDGGDIRELFADHIERAKKTRLYEIPEGSTEWNLQIGQIVDSLFQSDVVFVGALLARLVRRGRRLVIVLDNTDQQGEEFQERVFLFAQALSQEHRALCIVALREERFFAAFRRGIFDAFGDRRFHIGSPDLGLVLRRRLDHGRERFQKLASDEGSRLGGGDLDQIDKLLTALIRSTTQKNANIVRMLACVSNGDMRHALDLFRDFVSSGNTNVAKILEIVRQDGNYCVPFHEFAKSAILGSRRFFRSSKSHIVNVFKKSSARRASHLTGIRVLARLGHAEEAASAHGEGFVKTATLLQEYRGSFGGAADFEEVAGDLCRRGLVESEPPRCPDIAHASALRIAASGAYYWRYLVRAFAYLDIIFVDTPVHDRDLARKLGELASATDLPARFRRVRLFLDFLKNEEESELREATKRSGVYREPLMEQVRQQVEHEIAEISRKTGTRMR